MRAKQLKHIVNFISQHQSEQTQSTIRSLLKNNPEQFIDLLMESIEKANVVPKSVTDFVNELNKIAMQESQTPSAKQHKSTKEKSTMSNQKKTSIIERLTNTLKSAWVKAIGLITISKVKLAISAAIVATAAAITSKGTAILTVIALLKSNGLLNSAFVLFRNKFTIIKQAKNFVVSKFLSILNIIKIGKIFALNKLTALKDFAVLKVKHAWSWINELFAIETLASSYERKAA